MTFFLTLTRKRPLHILTSVKPVVRYEPDCLKLSYDPVPQDLECLYG